MVLVPARGESSQRHGRPDKWRTIAIVAIAVSLLLTLHDLSSMVANANGDGLAAATEPVQMKSCPTLPPPPVTEQQQVSQLLAPVTTSHADHSNRHVEHRQPTTQPPTHAPIPDPVQFYSKGKLHGHDCPFNRTVDYGLCDYPWIDPTLTIASPDAQREMFQACAMRLAAIDTYKPHRFCLENRDKHSSKNRPKKVDCYAVEVLTRVFYPSQRGGVFVEVGALDGIAGSNTRFFQKRFGWVGLMMEASPKYFPRAWRNRAKGNVSVQHAAVCSREKVASNSTILFFDTIAKGMGGVIEHFSEKFAKDRIGMEKEKLASHRRTVAVRCATISDEVLKLGWNHIDIWSLDVEGSELVALEAFDFNRVTVSVILVELDNTNPRKDLAVRNLLQRQGYIRFMRLGLDDLWFHPKHVQPNGVPEFAKCNFTATLGDMPTAMPPNTPPEVETDGSIQLALDDEPGDVGGK